MDNQSDTYRATLQYAVAIAGGISQLAEHLKVTQPQLENWIAGVGDIPDRTFLAAVDVIIASPPEAISRSRNLIAKITRPAT